MARAPEPPYEQLDGLQGCDEPCARSYWRRAGNNADDAVTPPENQYSLVGIFYFALSSSMSSNVTLERESVQTKRNWPEESTALPW